MEETLDERIARLERELSEAREERRARQRQEQLSDLLRDPGVIVKPRRKPGPKPRPKKIDVSALGKVLPVRGAKGDPYLKWRFEVEFAGELVLGPPRDSSVEASNDLAKWRQDEKAREEAARATSLDNLWSPAVRGRQTCRLCAGEGEKNGRDCANCAGEGYRWP